MWSIRKPWTTSALVALKLIGRAGRHENALRRERELLADRADRHRTVGFDGAAEIAFDEFAGNVQGLRICRFDPGLRHGRPMDAGEDRHADQQADDAGRQNSPSPFDAGGDRCSLVVVGCGRHRATVIAPIPAAGTP